MLFNSFEFFVFYIVVTAAFFSLQHQHRWLLLLVASCVFYMFFIPHYILILFFTIIVDYFAGIWIAKAEGSNRKRLLLLSLVVNIGFLAVFKYYNFFIDNINGLLHLGNYPIELKYWNIILPVGLSFHTFQAMSYTIEVYRGNQQPERHFGIYALYVMFYPQLVAGPIERPQSMLHQFHEKHHFDFERFTSGLRLMLWGLFKKVVIADRLAPAVQHVYQNPDSESGLATLLATIFFAVQIYCDFSGYSDIALGSARSMGFTLARNFQTPYFSKSIGEFWRRWHISLNNWFRDYVYIPLGGNRVSRSRFYFNVFFVFLISGLWHGASWNFVVWGGFLGLMIIIEQVTKPISAQAKQLFGTVAISVGGWMWTIGVILISWVFFRATDLGAAINLLSNVFTPSSGYFSLSSTNLSGSVFVGLPLWSLALCVVLIAFLFIIEFIHDRINLLNVVSSLPRWVQWSVHYAMMAAVLILGRFETNEFIYFQF